MSAELRVALIGYGLGGRSFHAPFIAATGGLELAVIVTGDPERQRAARSEHPNARVIGTAAELFGHSRGVDLVVISAPNRAHVPLARQAMQAGLGVVIDKPMAPTSREARELVEEASRRGCFLSVYHCRRWDGDYLTMRRLVDEGRLGKVHRFESRFERWRPVVQTRWRESAEPEDAGGLLFDLGVHLIDQALHLFGPVNDVHAELHCRRPGAAVEDDVFLALTHASGVTSHLWTTNLAATPGPRLRVLGDRATYTKVAYDVQEEALRRGERPGGANWGIDPPDRWGTIGNGDDVRPVETERGGYQRFYEGVVAAMRDGAPPPVDPADAIASLEIIEGARRQVRRA